MSTEPAKIDHEAAKMWATGVLATGDGGIEQERDANVARAYLDLTQQLAGARALLEASAAHIWDGARELILNRGVEVAHARARLMEDATKRVRAFLAHTKGQNE